jgi:peptidoglycan hydrolase-like protein with peptidoglycan-binding domain
MQMTDVQITLTLPELRKGIEPDHGPTVVSKLQLMLNQRRSSPTLVVDGEFGPKTEASLKLYQQNENLTVDGVVGQETWTSLLSMWLLQSEPG